MPTCKSRRHASNTVTLTRPRQRQLPQSIIVKKTSTAAMDAALDAAAAAAGPSAHPSASAGISAASSSAGGCSREALNQRLRATMLGMSVTWFLFNLGGMQVSLFCKRFFLSCPPVLLELSDWHFSAPICMYTYSC